MCFKWDKTTDARDVKRENVCVCVFLWIALSLFLVVFCFQFSQFTGSTVPQAECNESDALHILCLWMSCVVLAFKLTTACVLAARAHTHTHAHTERSRTHKCHCDWQHSFSLNLTTRIIKNLYSWERRCQIDKLNFNWGEWSRNVEKRETNTNYLKTSNELLVQVI